MLQVDMLSKSYGDRVLFEGLTFAIERGSKVGLIATNGSGKSTLMNILVGREPSDSGAITYESDLRWAYLEQLPALPSEGTILQACFNPHDRTAQLVLRWEEALSKGDDELMEKLLPEMEALGAWSYEQRAKEILGALGIIDVTRSVQGISGGEAKRIALAATLISEPDLLFLDEPTNHLDLKSIEWLESYLSCSTMSLILITHDRYFLDRVCNQIIELDSGELYRYKGNYDYYLTKREERLGAEVASQAKHKNTYRRELEWMRRQPQARAGKARYRIDAFHELEQKLNKKRSEQAIELGSAGNTYIGKKIFEAQHVSKKYGEKTILSDFNYIFARYDKIGIVGENGVGKTTFLKMLLGEEPADSGGFDIGQTVRFGYYRQQDPLFDVNKRVIDIVQDIADNFEGMGREGERLSASQLLTQFLFPPERQYTPVSKLSGGERRRLYLCTVLVSQPNFLILDEPTNDLDIPTLQVLEEYLSTFSGCVIIVSHDRFFMDKVVDHLLCFEGNGFVRDFPGNYSLYRAWVEYQAELKREAEQELSRKASVASTPSTATKPSANRVQRLTYAEKRELEEIEQTLPRLEEEKQVLEQKISEGTLSSDDLVSASIRIGEIMEALDALVLRQLELEEKVS